MLRQNWSNPDKMSLLEKQQLFSLCTALLLIKADELGYKFTYGDVYRDPRVHGQVGEKSSYSSANSVHKERLALDLNLFKDGKYLVSSHDHKVLGEYWKSLYPPFARWGGDFKTPDGNHYSFEHQGRM